MFFHETSLPEVWSAAVTVAGFVLGLVMLWAMRKEVRHG